MQEKGNVEWEEVDIKSPDDVPADEESKKWMLVVMWDKGHRHQGSTGYGGGPRNLYRALPYKLRNLYGRVLLRVSVQESAKINGKINDVISFRSE